MLHTKFHDHRTISSVGKDFLRFLPYMSRSERESHLGTVTLTIYIHSLSAFPRRLHIKFGFDWPSHF